MTIGWRFDNSYSKLPESFISKTPPTPVKSPELIILNDDLAKELDLNFSLLDKKKLSELFSGNSLPEGSNAISQAYAGHQFGHFTMLGDGRAVLMGEHISKNNNRFDILISNFLVLNISNINQKIKHIINKARVK